MVTRTDNLFVGDLPFLYKETGKWPSHEERRGTRVSLKIDIAAQGVSEPLRCDVGRTESLRLNCLPTEPA